MKLAILAQSYLLDKTASINGTAVQLYNLTNGFNSKNVEVHYICLTKDRSKPSYITENGVHFYYIQAKSGVLGWKNTMPAYRDLLNEIKPDAIYVRGRNVLQYIAGRYAKKHNIAYVWGTNGEDSAELWKNVKRLKSSKKSIIKKLILLPFKAFEDTYINKGMKLSNVIVNQSISQQKTTQEILNKTGVVMPSYFYLTVQKEISKQNNILWLATLSKAKQPELFVDIINKIDAGNWSFTLAGGSSLKTYEEEITKLAEAKSIEVSGRIDFKDSFAYYQKAKIYINTSQPFADGLPNAYIQSWLSGTIVLSLHHNPNQWMETYNIGYCSNGDLNKLALKLQELIDNPQLLSKMSGNAERFAQHQFSNDQIIEDYINLFQNNA